jgi:hypothetical protein
MTFFFRTKQVLPQTFWLKQLAKAKCFAPNTQLDLLSGRTCFKKRFFCPYEKKKPNLQGKKLQQISLSDDCKSIIYGTLLGNGCLQKAKGYKNARLSIRHSASQSEYFDWKVDKLQEIAIPRSVQRQLRALKKFGISLGQTKKNFFLFDKLLFQSAACAQLSEIMSVTHKNKRLCIQRRWLNHLTPLSLAVWWCDDGSIIAKGRKGVLCTDGFDEQSVRLLADYLQTVWGIFVHVGAIKRDRKFGNYSKTHYYRLWFGTEQLKMWLRIILPHIPVASMLPKVILTYKHSLFQQRWISEVKAALPQFEDQIDRLTQKMR